MTERCETCRYWNKGTHVPSGMTVYTCRRTPPTPGAITLWPITKHDDWCGEWRARGESEAERWARIQRLNTEAINQARAEWEREP